MERKLKKERPLSQNVAPAGVFFFEKNEPPKIERSFYFCVIGRKVEDFKEKARISVEKKSLIFGADFRILNSTGGEMWEKKWISGELNPHHLRKGGGGHGEAAGQVQ